MMGDSLASVEFWLLILSVSLPDPPLQPAIARKKMANKAELKILFMGTGRRNLNLLSTLLVADLVHKVFYVA